jgi:fatty acid desaturase
MFWVYYALCTIIGGALVARLSLKIVKYPDRYPSWVQFLCFPLSSFGGVTIHKVMRAQINRPLLFSIVNMGVLDPQEDTGNAREKRAAYIFLTMVFLPLRLFWSGITMIFAGVCIVILFLIESIITIGSYGIKKCKRCVDV